MINNDLLINTNGYILSLLEKILDANIQIKGIENIPLNNPKMFVANHFTRTEAMLVPYALYNITKKKVGVIADDSLFKSYFGTFLENLGAMKKSNPNRNDHIVSDLITSCKDWMIFPEGRMVKAKDITKIDGNFCVKIDGACQRVHTGACVFALNSQYLKDSYYENTLDDYETFSKKYFINECFDISKNETFIVPINISYTKLRKEKNFLVDMVAKLFEDMDDNFKEELLIESNLVLNSKIIIRILEPISTKRVLESLKNEDSDFQKALSLNRYEITHNFMNKIYEASTINFDHIFILILFLYPKEKIEKNYFKRLIYLVISKLKKSNLFFDEDILDKLIYLISYEKYNKFEEILKISIEENLVIEENDFYIIKKEILNNEHTHHTIRLKNILRVILNEIIIIEEFVKLTKDFVLDNEKNNNEKLLEILIEEEKNEFNEDYEKFSNFKNIKPYNIGLSKYYESLDNKNCIIAIHGFSSAPKEMEELAIFFQNKFYSVICPRLKGHGTVPEDLKNIKWQQWYESISRAITIATLKHKNVFIVGFSTGGLLGLLSTKKHYKQFRGLICINAALKLNDIRINTLLPAISFWNDIVNKFNENEYAKDFVDNKAENPSINYDKHYISSIEQLSALMKKTSKNLAKIQKPILIIQAKDDPVVNVSSAYEIYEKIKSKNKKINITLDKKHVIVLGDNSKSVFNLIHEFISKFK